MRKQPTYFCIAEFQRTGPSIQSLGISGLPLVDWFIWKREPHNPIPEDPESQTQATQVNTQVNRRRGLDRRRIGMLQSPADELAK